MKLTKEQVKQWFIDIEEDMCGNANDAAEVHALRDLALSALSQTAPSAQEGVREAVKKLVGVALAVAANSDEEGAVAKVTEAANAALSATPSASALGEGKLKEAAKELIEEQAHTKYCGAIHGPGDETWVVEEDCDCPMKALKAALADTEGKKGD